MKIIQDPFKNLMLIFSIVGVLGLIIGFIYSAFELIILSGLLSGTYILMFIFYHRK